MPFGLDVRPFGERKTHSAKDADGAIEHLGEGMERADFGDGSGQRNIDVGQRLGFFLAPKPVGGFGDGRGN